MENLKFLITDRVCRSKNRERKGTIVKTEHPYYTVKWDRIEGGRIDGKTSVIHYSHLQLIVEQKVVEQSGEAKVHQIVLPENFDIKILADHIAESLLLKFFDIRYKN